MLQYAPLMRDSSMVEQWTLDPLILVRIQVPQPKRRKTFETNLKGFFLLKQCSNPV
jgi:hypothetical protein